MKIIAITSCTSGLAHTYIAKERLENSAKELGLSIEIETQGAVGVENKLSDEDIASAHAVLIATDIDILGSERFRDKYVVTLPINKVVRFPKQTLESIISVIKEHHEENL